jgi:DNA-binding PadR family transcriptional regulator
MSSPKIPALGYALLGLLHEKPSSGYDLRRVFSSTSMKTFSDSPGAIYPALRRLEQAGLIRGASQQRGMRRRQVFRLTPKGLSELRKWITRPVTGEDLLHGHQEAILRFAFSEMAAGPAAAAELLESLEAALKAYVAALQEELQAIGKALPTSARLAFECGIRGNQSLLDWAQYALAIYQKKEKQELR